MFDLEQFYNEAGKGKKISTLEIKKYLESFSTIIVWGIGNLGTEIVKQLHKMGIKINALWDIRYKELKEFEGIYVEEPFSEKYSKETTLVIFCIANVPVSPTLFRELYDKGWKNVLKGIYLYQGIICPLSIETPLNTKFCNNNELCTVCNCDRLNNIVIHKQAQIHSLRLEDVFSVDRIHFIINNFCNLRCKHCNRFMNTYPPEKKTNLDVEVVKYDIQKVMDAIHSIGVVILFGGETFLHPELNEIAKEVLKKDNFGSLLINTNGIADIHHKQLVDLKDKRVRVAFSNYLNVLNERQKAKFFENEQLLKDNGICIKVQNAVPTWVEVTTLDDKKFSEEEKRKKRKECAFPYLFVYDHKVFPCTLALSLYDLGIADYKQDYVDITKYNDKESLGDAIKKLMNSSSFGSCSHCVDDMGKTVLAAEQGYDERYALPQNARK